MNNPMNGAKNPMNEEGNGISDRQWVGRCVELAREAFETHVMKVVGPGHWRIKRPNRQQFWTDIVVMGNVGLAVWGDIDGMFFAYYSGAQRPEQLVHWMAKADPCSYGREKASIGSGGPELVDEYVDEVAIYDLHERLEDAQNEYDEEEWEKIKEEYTDAIHSAIERVQYGDSIPLVHMSLHDDIQELDPDCWEWLGGIGRVPSVRLIYALAAVRRLWELITEQEENNR